MFPPSLLELLPVLMMKSDNLTDLFLLICCFPGTEHINQHFNFHIILNVPDLTNQLICRLPQI